MVMRQFRISSIKGSVLTIDNGSAASSGRELFGEVRNVAGAAHRQSPGDPGAGHRRFPAQKPGQGRFLRVALGARGQFGFGPAGVLHPFLDEPFGRVFIGFLALEGRPVPPARPARPLGEPLREIRRAQPTRKGRSRPGSAWEVGVTSPTSRPPQGRRSAKSED